MNLGNIGNIGNIGTTGLCAVAVLLTAGATRQETPKPMVACYDSLADAILAVKQTEADFVLSLLDGHFHAAQAFVTRGDGARASAEMALFANEGDNAIGGVRKRLLEGGHHHNAEGEAKGIYEPGFVVVTRDAKQKALEAAAAMRQAQDEGARKRAWDAFAAVAHELTQRK